MGKGIIVASEDRCQLPKWAMHRPTRDLATPSTDQVGEGLQSLVDDRGEIGVVHARNDLGEHRHPEQPAVVAWQRALTSAHELHREGVCVLDPAGLEARQGKQTSKQPVARILRACPDQRLLELGQSTLLPAQHAEGKEI